ncbi:G-protein coupled receptor 157 isoform X2 [Phyllopteryx taeniolatus]|uniref:G-protein coupled receptor 157 isoform X2 n=1 Tax=Phyllopteryx taeniolatus TaxID=161469 RepID=UPI002AD2025A|nr:G-protein coupled receptor 157 isoform X2 [Phyllopteryx taeniolatus]
MAVHNHTVVYLSEQVAVLCSCAMSFLGSSLIIITYMSLADLRTTARKLLLFLSVADWLSAVSYAFGVWRVFDSDSPDCVAQGAISTFANTSSFFWTVAIAVYLYVFIVQSSQRAADNLVLVFHLVSWGVPLAITVAAVCLNKIGYTASEVSVGWCWVRIHTPDRVLWMLLTGKVWEFLAYLTLPILYILIKRHIHTADTIILLPLHGGHEADSHPDYLHRVTHLEHNPLHSAAGWIPGGTEPCAGDATWYRQHVAGSSQLYHVCFVHRASPHASLRLALLLPCWPVRAAASAGRHSGAAARTAHLEPGRARHHQ